MALILCLFVLHACDHSESPKPEQPKPMAAESTERDDSSPKPVPPPVTKKPGAWHCEVQEFAQSIDIAEASGATVLDSGELMVVGDSGTNGAYLLLDSGSGKELESGRLPLDRGASDDLEGLAHMNGSIFGITSSGWMREWVRTSNGFSTRTKSYPLAPWNKDKLICRSAHDSNCEQNYEGLCLLPTSPPDGECAGFAASKATGRLLCLTYSQKGKSRRLQIDASRSFQVANPKTLSGCHFDEKERLWFGNNFFAANTIGYIEDWRSFGKAEVTSLGPVGFGFDEAIAVAGGGVIYRFSDTTSSPSLLGKYICR